MKIWGPPVARPLALATRESPHPGAYSSVKFTVIGLSEPLAEEVKPFGVKVTVVAPGYFSTSFLDEGSFMIAKNRIEEYNTAALETAMQQMDGKQPGDPQKLVRLLVDFTSEKTHRYLSFWGRMHTS